METALRSPRPPADRRDDLSGTGKAGSRSTWLVLQFYLPLQTPKWVMGNLPETVPGPSPGPGRPQTGSAQGGPARAQAQPDAPARETLHLFVLLHLN